MCIQKLNYSLVEDFFPDNQMSKPYIYTDWHSNEQGESVYVCDIKNT